MNTAIVITVIGAFEAITVAIIKYLFSRETKSRKKAQDIRAQEGLLSLKLMSANTDLAAATAMAVQNGKSNGEMSSALQNAKLIQREYYEFINRIAAEQIAEK